MSEDLVPSQVRIARDAAYDARRLCDEHRRACRAGGVADGASDRLGEELKRLATETSAAFDFAKQQARVAASVKRRQESIRHDAELQGRLRAEAQSRREAAAAAVPPARRRGR
jgi:hypothetical protein